MNENGRPETEELRYVECPYEPLWHLEFGHFSMYLEPIYDPDATEVEGEEPDPRGIRMRIVPSMTIPGPGGQPISGPAPGAPQVSLLFSMEYWRTTFKDTVMNDGKAPPPRRRSGIIVAGADQAPGPGDLPPGAIGGLS